ncbi:MutS protein msh5 [Chamberlinius hualienensis]
MYTNLPELMFDVARNELSMLSADIKECSVAYLPQIGYLLSISMTERMRSTSNYELPNLTFMFTSNNCVYYKSRYTAELDLSLGDTLNDIYDLELQIMLKLQSEVLNNCHVMVDVMKYSAQLDCLIAMAKVAKEFDYVQPSVNHSDFISIKNGRHPLQELRTTMFVPNDIVSGGSEGSKLLVLTGPNSSGKSVYLKQVALIVFMAQIGSYVPAEEAVIGVVDAIFTRMYTSESVSIGLSSFMVDVNQISLAVRHATQHSLVIIDEFGKGTSATDGIALLAATLNFWINQRNQCPHVFVSTHIYGVIKWLQQSPVLSFKTFDTMLEGEELVYLFRLVEGIGRISYASQVAKKAGFTQEDYLRSLEVTKALCESKPIPARSDFFENVYRRANQEVVHFLQLDLNDEKEVNNFFELLRNELDDIKKVGGKVTEDENPIPSMPALSSFEE